MWVMDMYRFGMGLDERYYESIELQRKNETNLHKREIVRLIRFPGIKGSKFGISDFSWKSRNYVEIWDSKIG